MPKIVIGIDPGLTGAVARLGCTHLNCTGPDYEVWDAPTAKDGKHTVLLPVEMRKILLEAALGIHTPNLEHDLLVALDCIVFIEKVHSMPKQGVASSFNFGQGYGLWLGIIVGLGLRHEQVTPQRWQKEMLAGMQGGKDASIIRAQELFPDAPLSRKKDHGRADALLIAEHGRRMVGR